MVGLADKELTAMERAWLKLVRPAGIILFRRNIADAKQTRALLSEATRFAPLQPHGLSMLRAGRSIGLRDALAPMPSAQAVAQPRCADGKPGVGARTR